jgi:hypothetical protein
MIARLIQHLQIPRFEVIQRTLDNLVYLQIVYTIWIVQEKYLDSAVVNALVI